MMVGYHPEIHKICDQNEITHPSVSCGCEKLIMIILFIFRVHNAVVIGFMIYACKKPFISMNFCVN
jgi:hypothetical protein